MKQSELFSKSSKTSSAQAPSINHELLVRAGYIDQLSSGIYSFLPLGLRVIAKISDIIRAELNAIGGQEVFLPALHPKENWLQTGRWNTMDVLFKTKSQTGSEYALGPTHEEVIVPLAKKFIASYRDLPKYAYQIQTKFRDELRAKSGLLRGREFLMKDLYSFHATKEDLKSYYETVKQAYVKIFERCGLKAIITEASGGSFTKDFSHEFQVLTENGEDIIYHCECGWAQNKEIAKVKANDKCPACGDKKVQESKAIEVGNIFDLGVKFSRDFKLAYTDETGRSQDVVIGCYGIGISRLLGAIVEVSHDDRGLIWPESVAPFRYHLLTLSDDPSVAEQSEEAYQALIKAGQSVLWDDRSAVSSGEKLAQADLLGIPFRLVISPKTKGKIELKARAETKTKLADLKELL